MSTAFKIFEEVTDILADNQQENNIVIFTDILNALLEDIQTNEFLNNQEGSISQIQNIFLAFQTLLDDNAFTHCLFNLSVSLRSLPNSPLINILVEEIANTNSQDNGDTTSETSDQFKMDVEDREQTGGLLASVTTTHSTDSNDTEQSYATNILESFQRARTNSNIFIYQNQMSGSYGSGIEDKFLSCLGQNHHSHKDGDSTI